MITVVAANRASREDLQLIFGTRGPASKCQCQRYKLEAKESFRSRSTEERAARLREQTACGNPASDQTSGLVAYVDGEPAGWCAVEPRNRYTGLQRVYRIPWEGRNEDKADGTVWAITCFMIRTGYRKRGIGQALTDHAIQFARSQGARAIEGYPMTTTDALLEELHVGIHSMFVDAGFTEAGRPSKRRVVMRIDL